MTVRSRDGKITTQCCDKVRFANRETAERRLEVIRSVSTDHKIPIGVYQCKNDWWHLTSKGPVE